MLGMRVRKKARNSSSVSACCGMKVVPSLVSKPVSTGIDRWRPARHEAMGRSGSRGSDVRLLGTSVVGPEPLPEPGTTTPSMTGWNGQHTLAV